MQQCSSATKGGAQDISCCSFWKLRYKKRTVTAKGITGIKKIKFEGVDYTNEESASVVVDWWTMIEQKPRSQAAPFTLNHNRELDSRKSAPMIDGWRCEQGAATPLSATAHYVPVPRGCLLPLLLLIWYVIRPQTVFCKFPQKHQLSRRSETGLDPVLANNWSARN